jgi:translation initiation factor 4E
MNKGARDIDVFYVFILYKNKMTEIDDIKENINNEEQSKLINKKTETLTDESDLTTPLILLNKQIELIHPLEQQWTFWYLKNQQGKDWQENLMKLATFGYVEEFWA